MQKLVIEFRIKSAAMNASKNDRMKHEHDPLDFVRYEQATFTSYITRAKLNRKELSPKSRMGQKLKSQFRRILSANLMAPSSLYPPQVVEFKSISEL